MQAFHCPHTGETRFDAVANAYVPVKTYPVTIHGVNYLLCEDCYGILRTCSGPIVDIVLEEAREGDGR